MSPQPAYLMQTLYSAGKLDFHKKGTWHPKISLARVVGFHIVLEAHMVQEECVEMEFRKDERKMQKSCRLAYFGERLENNVS